MTTPLQPTVVLYWVCAQQSAAGAITASPTDTIAMANVAQTADAGNTMVSVGIGSYRGQTAAALGFAARSKDNRWVMKGSVSASGSGVGAGFGYQW